MDINNILVKLILVEKKIRVNTETTSAMEKSCEFHKFKPRITGTINT